MLTQTLSAGYPPAPPPQTEPVWPVVVATLALMVAWAAAELWAWYGGGD